MKKLIIALAVIVTTSNVAYAEDVPLNVYKEYIGNVSGLRATSVKAGVIINKITLNDGECMDGNVRLNKIESIRFPNARQRQLPHEMAYGEKRLLTPSNGCNIIKATISTNQGDWTWTFD